VDKIFLTLTPLVLEEKPQPPHFPEDFEQLHIKTKAALIEHRQQT